MQLQQQWAQCRSACSRSPWESENNKKNNEQSNPVLTSLVYRKQDQNGGLCQPFYPGIFTGSDKRSSGAWNDANY